MRSAGVAFVIAFVAVVLIVGAVARGGVRMMHTSIVGPRQAHRDAGSDEKDLSPTVDGFHVVHANGPINVKITSGATPSLTFHARADVLPLLTSEVKDGVLTIGMNDTGKDDIGEITATIVTPNIDGVTLNGSGNVEVEGVKSADFSGGINGSGNLDAKGTADAAEFTLSGSGNIEAKELLSSATTVKISGSGNANVNAAKKLEATVEGSGDVHFSGNPPDVHRMVMGSGSVEAD